jgi:hypothetical protein
MSENKPLDWVDVSIRGLDDDGPFMTIEITCHVCGELISEQGFDARNVDEGERASNAGIEDARAAVGHMERHA